MKIIPINTENLVRCHQINEDNTPEVGTTTLEEFQSLMENSDYAFSIAEEDKVIGFVICFQDSNSTKSYMDTIMHKNFKQISKRVSDFLYIDRIAVDENYRNQAIGTKLYSEVIDFADTKKIKHLTAEINLLPSKNTPSFNFHKKFNFSELDTVKYSEDYEVSLQVRMNS